MRLLQQQQRQQQRLPGTSLRLLACPLLGSCWQTWSLE
jgi:hypothetical protein